MSDGVCLRVNGERREYGGGDFPKTVLDLVVELGLDPKLVVAEVNGDIVGRDDFGGHGLQSGDRVELVRFVGGG